LDAEAEVVDAATAVAVEHRGAPAVHAYLHGCSRHEAPEPVTSQSCINSRCPMGRVGLFSFSLRGNCPTWLLLRRRTRPLGPRQRRRVQPRHLVKRGNPTSGIGCAAVNAALTAARVWCSRPKTADRRLVARRPVWPRWAETATRLRPCRG
jgi:hypothetical protein